MYKVIVLAEEGISPLGETLAKQFDVVLAHDLSQCERYLKEPDVKAIVVDQATLREPDLSFTKAIDRAEMDAIPPLLLLSGSAELTHKLKAFDAGCDDFLVTNVTPDELYARVSKSIFNRIANEQLMGRLDAATSVAHAAISSSSDLGRNLQLLLEMNTCTNLDELGQLFFRGLEYYGISGSLQMRSRFGVKNMEANGMTKDLESQLLWQLKDSGRYIDFGRRTVMNFANSSLLIRNMPTDPTRYGAVKDNTFALLQGLDARVTALDDHQRLLDEKAALKRLSADVFAVMSRLESDYTKVMKEIVNVVERAGELIQDRIPAMALTQEHEDFLELVTENCIADANRVFGEGLRVDEVFGQVSTALEKALDKVRADEVFEESAKASKTTTLDNNSGVDLF